MRKAYFFKINEQRLRSKDKIALAVKTGKEAVEDKKVHLLFRRCCLRCIRQERLRQAAQAVQQIGARILPAAEGGQPDQAASQQVHPYCQLSIRTLHKESTQSNGELPTID